MADAATPAGSASSRPASVIRQPEKRATEAFQVGIRLFYDSVCLLATFRDTLGAPNQLQNEFRVKSKMSPETVSEMDQK